MGQRKLHVKQLNNTELSRLINSLLRDLEASKVTIENAVVYTKLKTRLSEELTHLKDAIASSKDLELSKDIRKADEIRDNDLQLLANTIKLGRYAKTNDEKAAYQLLNPHFKNIRQMRYANYETESELINQMLDRFKESNYQTAIKNLAATKALQELTKSQAAFEALLLKNHQKESSKQLYTVKSRRQILQDTYLRLGLHLQIMAEETGTVAYTKLYRAYQANDQLLAPLASPSKKKDNKTPEKPEENAQPEIN